MPGQQLGCDRLKAAGKAINFEINYLIKIELNNVFKP